MRLLIDTLIALMLVGILGGIVYHRQQGQYRIEQIQATQQAVRAIQSQARYHAALGETPINAEGFPIAIDEKWFTPRPANLLLNGVNLPWLETAQADDARRFNPRYIVGDTGHAEFWYCPQRGLVRARVPMEDTAEETLDLYNLVNGTSLHVEDVTWIDVAPLPNAPESTENKPARAVKPSSDPIVRAFTGVKK